MEKIKTRPKNTNKKNQQMIIFFAYKPNIQIKNQAAF